MSNISYSAIRTILFYEIKIFFREFQFNIIAPLISTCLFVFILYTVQHYYSTDTQEGSYMNFLIPGIIIMLVIQTSYNHLSEVIISMKQCGSFNDYLTSPISRSEIFISFILSSIVVCLFVGLLNLILLSFFADFSNINYFSFFYYLILTIVIFSSIGASVGFISFTWDFKSSISDFFITPLSFLSGTVFSINVIEAKWKFIFDYNPIYYLVKGFRNSFNDYNFNFFQDLALFLFTFIFFIISLLIFKKGYKVVL